MKRIYDYLYNIMISFFRLLMRLHLYDVPGIKGATYYSLSKMATLFTKDDFVYNSNTHGKCNAIISLTTYGQRTETVYKTILSLANQTLRPGKIILWLDEQEFNDSNLPEKLKLLKNKVDFFEIRYCENLKPHKKYFYTMMEYPDCIVVTTDDDVFYPYNWLYHLYECYKKYPNAVCCVNAHKITCKKDGSISEYDQWVKLTNETGPSISLCPIGVGGVLYPPNLLNNELFDKEFIIENCLNADDLWLKTMSLINNVDVVRIEAYPYTFLSISRTQKNSLSKTNVGDNKNDEQLKNIMNKYGTKVRAILCEK